MSASTPAGAPPGVEDRTSKAAAHVLEYLLPSSGNVSDDTEAVTAAMTAYVIVGIKAGCSEEILIGAIKNFFPRYLSAANTMKTAVAKEST